MNLATSVIMDFVKVTNDSEKKASNTTVYGTAVEVGGRIYIQLDGSEAENDQLLPVSTTAEIRNGERVMVEVKNHSAVVTGNTSSPAARVETVDEVNTKVLQVNSVIAHEITADEITAIRGFITNIEANTIDTGKLTADEVDIVNACVETLKATYITGAKLTVDDLAATNAVIDKLEATIINCESLTTENVEAVNASVQNLHSKNAEIENLSVVDATIKYANIDFSRIGEAVLEEFYARSGLIENVTLKDGHITGLLAGVTIKGDLIEGNTIVADKLVIKGDDGLYYKLNTFGVTRDGKTHGIEYTKTDQKVDRIKYAKTETIFDLFYYVETGTEVEPVEPIPETPDAYTTNGNPVYSSQDGYYAIVDGKYVEVSQNVYEFDYTGVRDNDGDEVLVATHDDVSYYFYRDGSVEYLFERSVNGVMVDDVVTTEGGSVWRSNDSDTAQYFTIVDHKAYLVESSLIEYTAEQTEYNSLDGSIITAKSIVAEQIETSDLIAFDATIGGFVIDGNPTEEGGIGSIHSFGKESVDNTVQGVYLDSLGQVNIGDNTNFIKYVKNEDGTYSLAISANTIEFALVDNDGNATGETRSLASLGNIGEYVKIATYNGQPCIELGEADSNFKLLITNTGIQFMEGTTRPAYITNQALHIDKAVVENELRFGQFIWKERSNGNMGIVWTSQEVSE